MTDFAALLLALTAQEAEFIVVGGAAAIAHGSARLTQEFEVLYEHSERELGAPHCRSARLPPDVWVSSWIEQRCREG